MSMADIPRVSPKLGNHVAISLPAAAKKGESLLLRIIFPFLYQKIRNTSVPNAFSTQVRSQKDQWLGGDENPPPRSPSHYCCCHKCLPFVESCQLPLCRFHTFGRKESITLLLELVLFVIWDASLFYRKALGGICLAFLHFPWVLWQCCEAKRGRLA